MLSRRWPRVLAWIVALAGLGFLGWGVVVGVRAFNELSSGLSWVPLACSVVAVSATHLLSVAMMWLLLKEMGSDMTMEHVYSAVMVSSLAKHVPGGVWQLGAHLQWFSRLGVEARVATVTWGLNALATVGGAVFAGSIGWLVASEKVAFLAMGGVLAGSILLVPPVRWELMERLGRVGVARSWRRGLVVTGLAVLVGVALVAHGALLAMGLGLGVAWPAVAAAFPLAWAAGFLFVIAPNGIGAREGALVALLALWLPAPAIAVLAALSRLGFLIADAVGAAIGAVLSGRKARPLG